MSRVPWVLGDTATLRRYHAAIADKETRGRREEDSVSAVSHAFVM
jgi:hypothetical protein